MFNKFESHLYGIETSEKIGTQYYNVVFESHLYGIETTDCQQRKNK